jgi:photosystem II stability/assembly factor-like uncharacterized protein
MRRLGTKTVVFVLLAAGVAFAAPQATKPAAPAATYDGNLLKGLEYRNIGPFRGGRVTAVAGVPSDILTFYMGSTGGGVWKTTDGGTSWMNVSDGQIGAGSIGAIAVADSDPNVIYVGTGSACPRGNISPGDGLYKSTDAGQSWKHVGLRGAGQIARIRIHPTNPDLLYVAALGHIFGPNAERGVFRSRDGGRTWEKSLFVSDKAGAVDLAMDPNNPRLLYAAIWPVVRLPWTLVSGGEGGGIHKSTDAGDSWSKLSEGLPKGVTGRIGVAVSPANSNRVWAIVEAEEGGIFRSDDAGKSFRKINSDRQHRQRAWYYTHIYADPVDENTVYTLNTAFYKSVDGGRTYETIRVPHGDNHDLWLHPKNPSILINSNDGGANVSYNGGKTWSTQANQPTAEFYRVTTDNQFPYRVYGAQQDNSTMSIPSWNPSSPGITIQDWYPVGGGESGHIAVDPRNPNIVYAGSYGGTIDRYDHATGEERSVKAYPQGAIGQAARDLKYRFQWNAPIRISAHDPRILYHTSQYVHRSTNEGQSWEVISPDLTRNDKEKQDYPGGPITRDSTGVEVYDVIFAFEESPRQPGLLWAGSDDGLVHLSPDGGKTWQNVTPKEMPEWGQVNMIDPSPHDPGRAFIAVSKYKLDDFRPYLLRTDDYGKSWKLLTDGKNGIPANHFTRVVREDPDRKGLLYAGTEFGMYLSFNDGGSWQSLQLNLPVTPITDLQVKEKDLVVATQGRSFWILDDLTPLHQLNDEVARAKVHLFRPRDAYRAGSAGFGFPGAAIGKNPPAGAVFHYYLAEAPKDELTLEVLDPAGKLIKRFSSKAEPAAETGPPAPFGGGGQARVSANAGANRFVWDLRHPDAELQKGAVLFGGTTRGPKAVPGSYQVRLTVAGASQTQPFNLKKNPRLATTQEDFQKQLDLALQVRDRLSETHKAIGQIRDVRSQVNDLVERLTKAGQVEGVDAPAKTLVEKLTAIEEKLIQTKSQSGQDALNFPPQLDSQWATLLSEVGSADARPTDGSYQRFEELEAELAGHLTKLKEALDAELAAFNGKVREKGILPIILATAPKPTM